MLARTLKQGHFFFSGINNRAYSIKNQGEAPAIKDICQKLLNQSPTTGPINCNFISQVVDHWAANSDKLAIHCLDQDTGDYSSITYAELVKKSQQIAGFFIQQGFKKGDTVALMLGQRPAWWYGLAGLMRAGIGAVPCPRLLTSKDLQYRINNMGIKGIITAPEKQNELDMIRDKCPTLVSSLTTGPATKSWLSLNDVFKANMACPDVATTTEDPCLYLYTSGTTGQPKAVVHHHDYPFFHWPTGKRWLQATSDDLIYNASDTGWGFTVWITAAAWSTGSRLLIAPTNKKFNPKKMLNLLQDHPVTIFCAAPTVLRLLVAEPHFDQYTFPHLKRIVTVGEALDETVIQRFADKGVKIAVGFGQAETPLLIGRVDNQPHVPGTMGKPIDPYKVTILGDHLQPLSPGSTGQIAVDLVEGNRGGLMRGYAHAEETTKKAFSPDGRYYLTGDWATLRSDGYFIYQGRRDDLIKSRGYRIGPDEVEKAGMSHPAVAKIAVIGVKEPDFLAVTVKAYILLKPGIVENQELIHDIQEHIKRETAGHKYPRLIECLNREEWEKYETISGKIRRAALRERETKQKENQAMTQLDMLLPSPRR